MKHECVIGLLWHSDYVEEATIEDLKKNQIRKQEFNQYLEEKQIEVRYPEYMMEKVYTFKDYADKRKNTDLTRFDFCPYCGQPIDWKKIGGMDNEVD